MITDFSAGVNRKIVNFFSVCPSFIHWLVLVIEPKLCYNEETLIERRRKPPAPYLKKRRSAVISGVADRAVLYLSQRSGFASRQYMSATLPLCGAKEKEGFCYD